MWDTKKSLTLCLLYIMIIPLAKPNRSAYSEGKTIKESRAKGAAAKTEAEFVQIRLQIVFWETVIGAQNECLWRPPNFLFNRHGTTV